VPSENFELNPTEHLSVATVGPSGARQFFLLAQSPAGRATLACEKFHIQGLVLRIQQVLESQGLGSAFEPFPARGMPDVSDPDWRIGELGLGFHENKRQFVIVARELLEAEDADPESAATARFWVTADRVRAFARQAEQVLSSGRPICTYCGLPIDPEGHQCPASNGSRPIL
jgi:uncharacterized repeat protein (TIGR03847 family)